MGLVGSYMHYRKEIDGLRALAVLPVIFFHAGFMGFSGGYVGVDIFFVISGYLITSIILEEKQKSTFSIINFYERRARRILPALTAVLILTTVMAYLFMPAYLLKTYSQSVVSVTTFSSNIFFYLTNGYFSTAADEKPLLHTWSLAVEEQYYLFYPLLIVFFWSKGKRWLLACLTLLSFFSLVFAQYLSVIQAVDANFYLIFSRAWELFFGSIIAFLLFNKTGPEKSVLSDISAIKQKKEEGLSLLGLMLIVYSIIFFDEHTPFPSFYTLVPVLGTCLVIYFTKSTSYCGQFLSHKFLVSIGLISYSLYLWHQPLFAFLRLKSVGEPSVNSFILAVLLTFLLAVLSWKYLESPFRNKVKFSRRTIFKYSAISIGMFLIIGLIGHFNQGFEQRFDHSIYTHSMTPSPKRDCHTQNSDYLKPTDACTYFGKNITWAIFGDSHTVEPAYALARKLEAYDHGLVHLSFKGCPPALSIEVNKPGCSKWINESISYLENQDNISDVFLGFRHSYYLFGAQLDSYPNVPNVDFNQRLTTSHAKKLRTSAREAYWQSFEAMVMRLLKSGKKIHLLYPIPELPMDIHKAVKPFSILSNGTTLDLAKATSLEYYRLRHDFIINKLDNLPFGEKLHAIKPEEILCNGGFCPAVMGGSALYYDDNHLSVFGAELIADHIDLGQLVRTSQ